MDGTDSKSNPASPRATGLRSDLGLILAAWLLSLGIDFLLHAGILARLYIREGPFLLPAGAAFARIPLGYLAFLMLTASLWWLLRALDVAGAARGGRLGLVAGAVVWGALLVGLYSISTAPGDLLVAWWVGQSLELGAAGAVLGAGGAAESRRPIYVRVALGVLACFIVTVLLQIAGVAPVMESGVAG